MILPSDAIGIVAGLSLVVAPARDQWARWKSLDEAKKAEGSVWRGARLVLSKGWEAHRNRFSGIDSLTTAMGGLGLAISFTLKVFGV